MLVAITLGAILLAVAVPAYGEIVERVRHSAAVRQVISDVREARSHAISKGWEYRIVGYDSDSTTARRNQYRVLARRSSAVAWPDEDVAPFTSDTQHADRWVDVETWFPNVNIDTDDPRFEITFDSRGTVPDPSAFNPMTILSHDGTESRLNISTIGGVRIE